MPTGNIHFFISHQTLELGLTQTAAKSTTTTKNDCNGTRTHKHLARKRTFNHLTKFVKTVQTKKPLLYSLSHKQHLVFTVSVNNLLK